MACTHPDLPHELPALQRLRGLLDVTRLVRDEADLPTLLREVARTISETLGFGTVVVNTYRAAWDDFEVTTVHGSADAERELLGDTQGWEAWAPLLDERFLRRGAYFVPEGEFDWASDPRRSFIPDLASPAVDGSWRAEDALFVPLRHSDGHLLGILSVDEPLSGLRPPDEELEVLVAVAQHAALALESAQRAAEAARHRAALETLAQISSHLTATLPVDAVVQSICDGVRSVLGFDRVCIELLDRAAGRFMPRAAAGWALDDAAVQVGATAAEFGALLEPQYEVEGCYLLASPEAHRRVAPEHRTYSSRLNGRGQAAWNHHWLLVPLADRAGNLIGFLWADDPTDRLLPTRERLQALRMFGNQTQTALDFAGQFEALRAASEESRAVVEASPLAVVVFDCDDIVHTWSPAAERVFGWSAGEVVGRTLPIVAADAADDVADVRRRLRAGESIHGISLRRLRRDGSVVDVSCSAAPLRGPDGTVARVVAVYAEATERGRENLALDRLHRAVPGNTDAAVALLDLEGRTVYASPSHERLLGYREDELVGRGFRDTMHPDDVARAAAAFLAALGGESPTFVARVRHRDGRWVWLEEAPTVILDDGGNPELILTTARDVGDHHATRRPAPARRGRARLRLA